MRTLVDCSVCGHPTIYVERKLKKPYHCTNCAMDKAMLNEFMSSATSIMKPRKEGFWVDKDKD